jgi:hypothetical protein
MAKWERHPERPEMVPSVTRSSLREAVFLPVSPEEEVIRDARDPESWRWEGIARSRIFLKKKEFHERTTAAEDKRSDYVMSKEMKWGAGFILGSALFSSIVGAPASIPIIAGGITVAVFLGTASYFTSRMRQMKIRELGFGAKIAQKIVREEKERMRA